MRQLRQSPVNDLGALKTFLISNGVKIKDYSGWSIETTKKDRWTMAHGVFYKNDEPIKKKDIIDSFKKHKKKTS